MKKTILLKLTILAAVLLTASVASAANSTWIRPTVDGPGDYGDSANWDAGGVPTLTMTPPDEVLIGNTAATLAEVQVTDAQFYGHGKFKAGLYNGAVTIRITSTGSLTGPATATVPTDERRLYFGYGSPCHLIIEPGGVWTHYGRAYAGLAGGALGTVLDIAGTLDTSQDGGKWDLTEAGGAQINILDGGLLKLRVFDDWGLKIPADKSVNFDVQGTGKITALGDVVAKAQALIDTGNFYGNGILGELIAVYDAGADETSIIASSTPAAQDLLPEDGDDDVPVANPLTLSWTIPSAYDGNDVYVKVWLGTDPNALTAEPNVPADYMSPVTLSPASGLNVTSVDIDASVEDTYYWRVDLDVQADPNFFVIGKVQSFTTVSDLPPTVSIDTPDTITWSDEPVAIAATVTDDGTSTLTYGWTADPDGSGDPNLTVAFSPDASAEDPTVTITNTTGAMVPVTLTLTATDAVGSADASVTIDVYEDACQMALYGVGETHLYADYNFDCKIDVLDLVVIAQRWLNTTTLPTGPVEK